MPQPLSPRISTRLVAAGCMALRVWAFVVTAVVMAVAQNAAAEERQEEPAPSSYGRAPDTVLPFGHFGQPYNRSFQTKQEFLGTGRDAKSDSVPERVRIGLLVPLGSAPDADLGRYSLEGVALALEEANAAGGYHGTPFELVTRQDAGLWGASSNEMVAFKYEDDVLGVIGSIDGANTHIALRVALKVEMPMVNTGDTDPTLTETAIPWLLRCMGDDRQQGYALAHHIINECGIREIAAFRVNDRFGRTGMVEFRDAARRLKCPLRAELRWDRGERDFSVQLDRIAQLDPEAVLLWGNAHDTAAVVKEIRRRKMPQRIFGCDRLASPAFLEQAGEAAEGVVAAATFDPSSGNPLFRTFADSYVERFGRQPEAFAAHAYDGANILVDAIRQAGLNRARIRDALHAYEHYDGVTGLIVFDATLNDIGPVYLATVKDGRFHYAKAEFGADTHSASRVVPYRTLQQSPPVARSPEHRVVPPDVIRIGCFLPLDDMGRATVAGAKRALEEDAAKYPDKPRVELIVHDLSGAWGDNSRGLTSMVFESKVQAVIGSTERRGTHLTEMLAAKMHFPVLSLCATDPTTTQIPLPWVFCVSPSEASHDQSALGYDAACLVLVHVRAGVYGRRTLRDALAASDWYRGETGTFRFGPLGRRIDKLQ